MKCLFIGLAQSGFIRFFRRIALWMLCVALAGCVSVSSLDDVARSHPLKPAVSRVRDRNRIAPLPRESLIGKWKGVSWGWEGRWYQDGSYRSSNAQKLEVTYDFKEDGTFTKVQVFNGKAPTTTRGTWSYKVTGKEGGDLTLNNIAQPHNGVFWYDRDTVVIQVANVNIAKDWRLKWATSRFDSGYTHKVWYERDDYLNDHIIEHHVSASKGYRQEELWTPVRCKRIATSNSPSLKTITTTQSAHLKQSELGGKPPYRIIELAREKDSDFAYAFTLELSGDASIQTFFGIQAMFANEVRAAYQMEYPNADASALRVVVQPRLSNGKIVGRAEVLTITPVSLSYDAGSRRGKLSVRFNPGQAEEARAWVRKNIETLAQDKNIALTTGQLPPAATFYSLGERIDGNVMEIEFRTE